MSISLSVLFSETPKSGGAPPVTTALQLVSTMVNVVQIKEVCNGGVACSLLKLDGG